jgi:hypothetical protein
MRDRSRRTCAPYGEITPIWLEGTPAASSRRTTSAVASASARFDLEEPSEASMPDTGTIATGQPARGHEKPGSTGRSEAEMPVRRRPP